MKKGIIVFAVFALLVGIIISAGCVEDNKNYQIENITDGNYVIVKALSLEELSDKVNLYMNEGFIPAGITKERIYYLQVMYKNERIV